MIKFFKIIFRGCYSQCSIILNCLGVMWLACSLVVFFVMMIISLFFPEINEYDKYWICIPCGVFGVVCYILGFYLESNDRYKKIVNEPRKYTVKQEKIIANSFLLVCIVGIPIALFLIFHFFHDKSYVVIGTIN